MFCKNCGTKIEGEMKFCPSCGTVVDNNEEGSITVDNNDTSTVTSENSPVNNVTSYQSPATDNYSMPNANSYGTNYSSQVPNGGMQQPMYNQPYGNPTNNGKKNNSVVFIIIGIAVALVVCVGIIIYSNMKNNNDNTRSNSNVTSNSNSNLISNSNSNSYSNSNLISNSNSNSYSNSNITSNPTSNVPTGNTITFKGYVFQVPTNYTAQTKTSQLQLIGKNNIDVAAINIQAGNFDSIKASKETIKTYMTNAGYTVNNIQINTYGGVEFVTAEVNQSGRNMILGYAKLNASTIFMVVTASTNNVLNYNVLNEVAPMITTAKVAS